MRGFYKRLWQLLFFTLFLLLVAWAAMQLMQNGWNLERLMLEAQKALEKYGGEFVGFFQEKLAPAIRDGVQQIRSKIG